MNFMSSIIKALITVTLASVVVPIVQGILYVYCSISAVLSHMYHHGEDLVRLLNTFLSLTYHASCFLQKSTNSKGNM